MSMALHILVGQQNVHIWWLVLIYVKTPPNHYHLESSGRAAYMQTHPYLALMSTFQSDHGVRGPQITYFKAYIIH